MDQEGWQTLLVSTNICSVVAPPYSIWYNKMSLPNFLKINAKHSLDGVVNEVELDLGQTTY